MEILGLFIPKRLRLADLHERRAMRASEPTDAIPYRQDLIPELRAEHKSICRAFDDFVVAHRNGSVEQSVASLKQFSHELRAHLLKENLSLYVYLTQALQKDRESSRVMHEMRKEMYAIGRELNEFIVRYSNSPWSDETREHISKELEGVARILHRRIEHEETKLYCLYLPKEAYSIRST